MFNSMMKTLYFLAAIFLLCGAVYGQNRSASASSPADAIRALDKEWLTAYDRQDAGAIQRIFAEDARIIHSDGRTTFKPDELTNVLAALPPEVKAKWRAEEIEVRFYGKTAISSGVAVQEGNYKDQPFARKYRYTNVYVRQKEKWQLVSAQYSRIEK